MEQTVEYVIKKNTITHWTASRAFKLEPYVLQKGQVFWRLMVDDVYIANALSCQTLATGLANGEFDDKLGFSTKSLGLPANTKDWNGLS